MEVLWRLLECQLSVGPLLLLQVSARQNDGWGPFWKYSFSVKQGLAELGAPYGVDVAYEGVTFL